MSLRKIYYVLKPLMPRKFQIALRRRYVAGLRALHVGSWPINENAARPPAGWPGWPEGKKFAFVLTHDADTSRGHDRCLELMELEKSLGFRSAFNLVPRRYDVCPDLRKTLLDNGFEVGVHGSACSGRSSRRSPDCRSSPPAWP